MSRLHVSFRNPGEVADFVTRVERYPYAMDILGFNQVMNLNVYAEDCGQLFQDIKPYIAA